MIASQALVATGVNTSPSKVPEVTFGSWIIKILATTLGETGGDTVTMTWFKADVVANAGYLIGSAIFLSALVALVLLSNLSQEILSLPLLGGDRGVDHCGYDHGRLCYALARRWLYRRHVDPARLPDVHARCLVLVARVDLGDDCHHAEGRGFLLGRHHLLADLRDRARRLGCRHRRPRL